MLDWGVKRQVKEATTSKLKTHPQLCLLLPPVLFGSRHVHSGPNGLRACICLKNNKIKKKNKFISHTTVSAELRDSVEVPGGGGPQAW